MESKYIDWIIDLKPSTWCLYAQAYAQEFKQGSNQSFKEFLEECFKREIK